MAIQEEIRNNKIKSAVFIAGFILFVAFVGYIIGLVFYGGFAFLIIAGIFAISMALFQYYHGDKMVLKLSKAIPATKEEHPTLINAVEGLCISGGIPQPNVYVIKSEALNAFATGRDPKNASIAATTGLLNRLDRNELEGVIAHELSHIKNYDIRMMTIVIALVGIVSIMAHFMLRSMFWGGLSGRDRNRGGGKGNAIMMAVGLVLVVLSPFIAQVIKLSISRKREFLADASGAHLSRYPEGLASALEKIRDDHHELKNANSATEGLYFANPFKKKDWFTNMFSTHPPLEERIERLRKM